MTDLSHKILKLVNESDHPLHTAEISRQVKAKSHYRAHITLIRLMNDGKIQGRLLDVAKGIWIWQADFQARVEQLKKEIWSREWFKNNPQRTKALCDLIDKILLNKEAGA